MPITIDIRTMESLTEWLAGWLAGEIGVELAAIDVNKPFLSYGLNSVQAMMLAGDLEVGLQRSFPPTVAWDYPCITALAAHLFSLTGGAPPTELAAAATPANGAGKESRQADTPLFDPSDREELLSRIDQLSEEQIDEILHQYIK